MVISIFDTTYADINNANDKTGNNKNNGDKNKNNDIFNARVIYQS